MLRLLFWGLLMGGAFWCWRKLNPPKPHTFEPEVTQMVQCAHCRLHLPQDQAVRAHGQWYCGAEHAAAPPKK